MAGCAHALANNAITLRDGMQQSSVLKSDCQNCQVHIYFLPPYVVPVFHAFVVTLDYTPPRAKINHSPRLQAPAAARSTSCRTASPPSLRASSSRNPKTRSPCSTPTPQSSPRSARKRPIRCGWTPMPAARAPPPRRRLPPAPPVPAQPARPRPRRPPAATRPSRSLRRSWMHCTGVGRRCADASWWATRPSGEWAVWIQTSQPNPFSYASSNSTEREPIHRQRALLGQKQGSALCELPPRKRKRWQMYAVIQWPDVSG